MDKKKKKIAGMATGAATVAGAAAVASQMGETNEEETLTAAATEENNAEEEPVAEEESQAEEATIDAEMVETVEEADAEPIGETAANESVEVDITDAAVADIPAEEDVVEAVETVEAEEDAADVADTINVEEDPIDVAEDEDFVDEIDISDESGEGDNGFLAQMGERIENVANELLGKKDGLDDMAANDMDNMEAPDFMNDADVAEF